MELRENVKIQWQDLRSEAISLWRKDIDAIVIPEMADRGFTLSSKSFQDPLENNEVGLSWGFEKSGMYLWLDCRSHMGINANLFPKDKPKQSKKFPPRENPEDNMSFHKFFDWLDKQEV